MPELFDALPGQEVPVGGIAAGFRKLWADTPAEESRAVQLNLVLHLGRNSSAADALAQFKNTVAFAHRYPCRVVVLCPDYDEKAGPEMRAKIYGECFFGKSKNDTRCVEFVILHYTISARQYLESQVSVCLSTDLPLYYWAHNFSSSARLGHYQYLLGRAKRVLLDRSLVPEDDCGELSWPHPEAVRAFVEQSARAADWSREHPDEARKVVAKILNERGENGDLAQYWGGFGLRQGARATERDLDFWIGVLERDGSLPKGKYRAADLLLPVEAASSN